MTESEKILYDVYKTLYMCSTPSADYDELFTNGKKYIDSKCVIHTTEKPLTQEECLEKGWLKYINYMDYSISQGLYIAIVENIIAKYNLNAEKSELFKNTVNNGHGPCIDTNETNFTEQMLIEFFDLDTKKRKLNYFIESDKFQELDLEEQDLTKEQYQVMRKYLNILYERINRQIPFGYYSDYLTI